MDERGGCLSPGMTSSMFITQCKSLGQSRQVCGEKKGLVCLVTNKQRLLKTSVIRFSKALSQMIFFPRKRCFCLGALEAQYLLPASRNKLGSPLKYLGIYHQYAIKNLLEIKRELEETWVQSLDWEDPLEKGKATHSSILAWRIPCAVQPMEYRESDKTERLSLSLNL